MDPSDQRDDFRLHPIANASAGAEDHHPRPLRAALSRRRRRRAGDRLQRPRRSSGTTPSRRSAASSQALAEAGCRYVQIDETAFAKFGDPEVQAAAQGARRRLERADRQIHRRHQPRAERAAGSAHRHASVPRQPRRPVAFRRQLRRGRRAAVQRAEHQRSTSWNTIRRAPAPSRRCGFVPRHKTVVLGLVSTKTPVLENKDDAASPYRGRHPPSRSRSISR